MKQERITNYLLACIASALTKQDVADVLAAADVYAGQKESGGCKNETPADTNELRDTVNRLYRLYPSKTIRNNIRVSTGKCAMDKRRIERLLRKRTAEEIESAIIHYVDENKGVFLKNFSTFLNNMPEPEAEPTARVTDNAYKDV